MGSDEVETAFGLGPDSLKHVHPVGSSGGEVLQDDSIDDGEGSAGDVVVGVVLVHVPGPHL